MPQVVYERELTLPKCVRCARCTGILTARGIICTPSALPLPGHFRASEAYRLAVLRTRSLVNMIYLDCTKCFRLLLPSNLLTDSRAHILAVLIMVLFVSIY